MNLRAGPPCQVPRSGPRSAAGRPFSFHLLSRGVRPQVLAPWRVIVTGPGKSREFFAFPGTKRAGWRIPDHEMGETSMLKGRGFRPPTRRSPHGPCSRVPLLTPGWRTLPVVSRGVIPHTKPPEPFARNGTGADGARRRGFWGNKQIACIHRIFCAIKPFPPGAARRGKSSLLRTSGSGLLNP